MNEFWTRKITEKSEKKGIAIAHSSFLLTLVIPLCEDNNEP